MIRRPPRSPLFPTRRSSDLPQAWAGVRWGPRLERPRRRRHPGHRRADRKSTRLNSSHGSTPYPFFFFNDTATTEISTLSYTTLFRSPPSLGWRPLGTSSGETSTPTASRTPASRSEEHTSELQSRLHPVSLFFF